MSIQRKTPLKRGAPLKQKSELKRSSTLKASKPMERSQVKMKAHKPVSMKPKRAARNAGPVDYLALCRGQPCYLLIPGVGRHDPETVVPCHSNSSARGKGMGLKALDIYTVPGCHTCHHQLDQGRALGKAERHALWDAAYERWEVDRAALIAE